MNELIINIVSEILVKKSGEKTKVTSVSSVGGGCIHNASKIHTNNGNFFLKWNTSGNADIFEKEADGLIALKAAAGDALVIPEVIAFAKISNTPGFLLMQFLEQSERGAKSDEKLGRGLAQIHRYSETRFGHTADNYCGSTLQNNNWKTNWAEFYRDNRLGFLLQKIKSKRQFTADDELLFDRLLHRLPGLIPYSSIPALIHGDLWSGNYMHTNYGAALIDPAVSFSDREAEFGMITLFGGFSSQFFDAYNESFPLPEGWRERTRLYQLYHILNHYLIFGGGYLSQAKQIASTFL